jgi:hypothetical protein
MVFGVTYVLSVKYIQLCGCVSFLVVAGNNSQNENTFLQKNLIGFTLTLAARGLVELFNNIL